MAFVDESLWSRLSPLLDQALELEGERRDELVREVRERDAGLAEALERHLAEHESALARGFLAWQPPAAAPALEGRTFGAYELVERLGAGGMGTVWRARRSDGRFEGDVALKLLHPSLLDDRGVERFRAEGTILSRLNHPGIARLYDAGVSSAGQPYLVLELVDGERIDRWAAAHRLPVRERLELFLQVADAVASAHSSLVVHRDLKPSNILVGRDGRAKLLDFGIATLVDQASGVALGQTVTAARMLTPEYAAPEQLEGGTVTTATDVYALGVLLHELLTGEHPFSADRADRSPASLVRAITGGETGRMSERVRRTTAPGAADPVERQARLEARATTSEKLARSLAGDLDVIVAKALKRPVAERYPTVAELTDDLRRHLEDRPVRARPDSLAYRARKLFARRRLEIGAAAVAIAALLAATAISWRQARASAAERDRALADLRRSEVANDFANFLLAEAPAGGEGSARSELLRRGETMIERRFAGDPTLQAHLLLLLADLHEERITDPDPADVARVSERALALAAGTGDLRLRAVAACHLALAALLAGDTAGAETHFASAFDDLSRTPDSEREEAKCRMFEGHFRYRTRDYERSIRANERALELERRRPGPTGRRLDVLDELGGTYAAVGRGADSDRSFAQFFAELEAQGREVTQPAYISSTNWAVSLQRSGQFLRAIDRWQHAIDIARQLDPKEGASSFELVGAAMLLPIVGRQGDAVAAMDEALAKTRAQGDPASLFPIVVRAARIYAEAGRLDEAERFLAEAAELARAPTSSRPDLRPPDLDRVRAILAFARHDPKRSAGFARAALGPLEQAKRSPRDLVPILLLLARAENDRGETDAARAAAERALAIATELRGDHPRSGDVGAAELERARALLARGESAAAALATAIENLEATEGEASPDLRRALALRDEVAKDARARRAGAAAPSPSRAAPSAR